MTTLAKRLIGRRSLTGVLLVAMLSLAASVTPGSAAPTGPTSPAFGSSRLYLSWKAPSGMPGATDRLSTACNDTSEVDTLFVSFEVTRPTPGLEYLSLVVYFHPLGGDTLGSFWHFKRGWENQLNMLVDFDAATGIEGELPWEVMGYGNVSYDHRSGRGRLDLGFRVPRLGAKGLRSGERYTCARIRIRHRRDDLSGCRQPVCIEAADLDLKFATGRRLAAEVTNERFVSWNTSEGAGCRPPNMSVAKPWRPK